jgi:pseudouridine-5'-phosphate glycosidase
VTGLCEYGDEVARAVATKAPIVALETTVVTHGLPHPDGLATALVLEQVVRDAGATPATIGILGGAIRIGLTRTELELLATTPNVAKIDLSNLAAAVASGQPGSTTVAATMLAAFASNIRVFATGGIGGVHRGASDSGDISADLTALSRIPVAVVSAGAKAILDLPRTVEMLETLGVPVFGRRSTVPHLSFNNPNAFYELGIRHMCKLPTVQIIRKGDKIPFDVSQGRTIKIDMSDVYTVIESVESAKRELKQHLRHALSDDYKGEDNPVTTYLPGVEVKLPK